MARTKAKNLGIGRGISSRANMIARIIAKEKNDIEIVTGIPDDNKKYITTDLSKQIDNNSKFISNKIEIIDYEFV